MASLQSTPRGLSAAQDATYEVIAHEAVLVRELFRRYTDDAASIADLARWLGQQCALTRTGKTRWDRNVVWGMLRNRAYTGRAVYGKTQVVNGSTGSPAGPDAPAAGRSGW